MWSFSGPGPKKPVEPQSTSMERAGKTRAADWALPLAHVGLGSNLSPDLHIVRAVLEIRVHAKVLAASRFYRNPAYAPSRQQQQPEFVNGVLRVQVCTALDEFRYGTLRKIESRLGRIRTSDPFAPRVIDLDLLTFQSRPEDRGQGLWADPEIFVRPYWAIPLAELSPDLRIPGTDRSLGEHAAAMERSGLVYLESLTCEIRRLLDLSSHD